MVKADDLKYFIELAKTLHVTRAAERLGISQPALSHCITRLETEMGCQLFNRSKKGVTLNSSGKKLFKASENLLRDWENLKKVITDENTQPQGRINFGSHTAVTQFTVPLFLERFLRLYPDIEIKLSHGLSRHMTEAVISQKLDCAIVVNPVENLDLIIKPLCTDEVTLWKSKNCQNSDVLIIEPELLQSQDILKRLEKKGIRFKRHIESSSLEIIANLIVHGVGYGIAPTRIMKTFSNNNIDRIKDAPVFKDQICLVHRPEFRKIKRGQVWIDSILETTF
jgi:LysR family transcriptional regulator, cell division regulator